jgi:hypothetical protein
VGLTSVSERNHSGFSNTARVTNSEPSESPRASRRAPPRRRRPSAGDAKPAAGTAGAIACGGHATEEAAVKEHAVVAGETIDEFFDPRGYARQQAQRRAEARSTKSRPPPEA